MAVRLAKGLTQPRTVTLGEGVTLTVKPMGFADYKAAQSRAARLAQDRLSDAGHAASQTVLAGEDAAEYRDRLQGIAEEILLDALVEELATGWEGVEDEAGNPIELTRANWQRFRSQFPLLASNAIGAIFHPLHLVEQEGNGSAPSSSGT